METTEKKVAVQPTQYQCAQGELTKVPFADLMHNPENPRFRESMDAKEMWASIVAASGLLVALVVRDIKESGKIIFRLLQGGRRLSGLEYGFANDRETFHKLFPDGIPAIVHKGLSDREARNFLVDHNTKNLRRPEILRAVRLLRLNGETMKQMSERFGRKQGTVQPLLRLIDLDSACPGLDEAWTKYTMGWGSENDPKITNEVIQNLQKAFGEKKDAEALKAEWARVLSGEVAGTATLKPLPWSKVESLYKELPEGPIKVTFEYIYGISSAVDGPGIKFLASKTVVQ